MAITQTITNTQGIYQMWLEVTEDNTNSTANTSNVSWVLKAKATSTGVWYSMERHRASITINGNNVFSRSGNAGDFLTVSINASSPGTVTELARSSSPLTIAHNNDGTKSINISFSVSYIWDGGQSWNASGTMNLTSFARGSSLALSKSSITVGDSDESLSISISPSSSSFSHELYWKGGTQTSWSNLGNTRTLTASDFGSNFYNVTSGTVTIKLVTKNGPDEIGSTERTFTVNFPENVCKPSINTMSINDMSGAYEKYGCYLQNIFKPRIAIGVVWKKGSTVKSVKYQLSSGQVSGDITAGSWTASSVVTNSGNITVTVTATDTRGYSATRTQTINVIPYNVPSSISLNAYRANENGDADDQGDRLRIAFQGSAFSIKNAYPSALVENNCEWWFSYKKTSEQQYTDINPNLHTLKLGEQTPYIFSTNASGDEIIVDQDYSYDITVWAKDDVTNKWFEFKTVLSSIVIPIDVLYNGRGVAIGKPSTVPNLLDVAWDIVGNGVKLSDSQPIYTDIVTDEYSHHAIRYGNGVQICYGWSRIQRDSITTHWTGTEFFSSGDISFGLDNNYTKYAQPFIDTNIGLTITPAAGGNSFFVWGVNTAKTHISNMQLGRPASAPTQAWYYFYYNAIGRWK